MPEPQPAERRQQLMDRLTTARQQGATWDQIHTSLNNRVETARKAGATDQQIQYSLGFSNADELIAATQSDAEEHMAATKPSSWVEAFVGGFTRSSSSALLGVDPDKREPQGRTQRIAAGVGETLGDVPAIVAGGVAGAIGGAAAGTAGGPGGVALGGYVGAGAGGNAAPQLIKSVRDRYTQALEKGEVKTPEEFLNIGAVVMKDTADAALVGGLAGAVGGRVAPLLEKMGAGKLAKFVGTAGAEGATMVTAQAALAGQMPRMEDYIDAAITIGAFHVAHKAAAPSISAIRKRLAGNYVETGELPQAAAERAQHDPVFRAQMLGRPDPRVPPGSSRTQLMSSASPASIASARGVRPLPDNVFMVPRVAGSFDPAVAWIFKHEGGMTTDTGGLTNRGISQKAHPGLDIAHLSKEDAAEIYHKEYWRAIDADALPPNMRLAAFDSAVNQGVGQTKTWLKQSKGSLQTFMKLRIEKYAQLARQPKYAKYANGWANRLMDLGVSEAAAKVIRGGPDNVGAELTPAERMALNLDGGGEGGKPPGGGGGDIPDFTPGDDGAGARIRSRVAQDEGVDLLGNTIEGFTKVYGELFGNRSPVRRLIDTVTKGDPLDDYANPMLLLHAADSSNTVAKWVIKEDMVDLDGNSTGHGLEAIISGDSAVRAGGRNTGFNKAETSEFLNEYALAKWALMMDKQKKDTGIDPVDAQAVVDRLGGKYEASFQHLVEWRNGTLKWLRDSGVVSADKYDKWVEENGSTIPGYRRMDDGSYRPVSTGKPGIWNPIKEAKGSERLIEPILKSLMQDAFLRHQIASNNRALSRTADLGILGNKATQSRAIDFNIISAMDALKEEGISEDMLTSLAKSAGKLVPADEVPIIRDGKLYGIKFEDKELTRVLRGYDNKARSNVTKIASRVTAVPRNMQTRYNPLFPIRNAFYDMVQQAVTNPDAIRPLTAFYDGLGDLMGNTEAYKAWGRSGAAEHIFTQVSNDAFIKSVMKGHEELGLMANAWNGVKLPLDALSAWTRLVSIPPRLSRYKQGLKKGETPLRAAIASQETATPPAHYGGPVGRAWNSIAPYTTAYLNGLEKTVKAVLGIGSTVTGVKYDWRKTLVKGAAIVTMPALATWFANKDEDWYKAMAPYQKNNAWFIIPPLGDLPPIPIAAPPLISSLFITMPRMMMEKFWEDNPHAFDDFWGSMGASLMPPTWITGASILTPIAEHITNHSFFRDRPLVDQNTVRGVQPAEQFTPYSSEVAKDLAAFVSDIPLVNSMFGWSPVVIDNYIAYWGGPGGRAAVKAASSLLESSTNPPPDQKVTDWPGVSSWTVRYPSANAAPIQMFYDRSTKLDQMYGSLRKTIRENDFERFKEIVDKGGPSAAAWQSLNLGEKVPEGVDVGRYYDYLSQKSVGADYDNLSLAHQAAKGLENARQYSWDVYHRPDLSATDKRQKLDMTNATMQVMAERGNEAMDRALIGVKKAGKSGQAPVPDAIFFEQPEQ